MWNNFIQFERNKIISITFVYLKYALEYVKQKYGAAVCMSIDCYWCPQTDVWADKNRQLS